MKGVEANVSGSDANGLLTRWQNPAMRAIQSLVAEIASTDVPVMVVGETGSGKEVIAAQIHRLSPRRNGALIKVRCSTLSPSDFDAHLRPAGNSGEFGDSAGKSTVVLDEIGGLDFLCQSKLVDLLSSADGTVAGPDQRAWVATTTCLDLDAEVRAGRFREDLYYRISGITLRLPPLRQRREDIPVLTDFFLAKYAALFGRPQPPLSAQARQVLQGYSWPGNIRELENVIKRIVALSDERAALADIERSLGKSQSHGYSLKQAARAASRQAEKELILKVLGYTKWNRKRAAQQLQISYKALLYKLKQIRLDDSAA